MKGQIDIFEVLQQLETDKQDVVQLTDIVRVKGGIQEYCVSTNYADIVLIISMLHDYIRLIAGMEGVRSEYYKERFRTIAEYLENGIDYNYAAKLEKCKSKSKDKDDRLGEDWLAKAK